MVIATTLPTIILRFPPTHLLFSKTPSNSVSIVHMRMSMELATGALATYWWSHPQRRMVLLPPVALNPINYYSFLCGTS